MSMTETPAGPDGGAAANVAQFRDRLTSLYEGFSKRQRTTLAMTAGLVVVVVLALSYVNGQTDWAPLYTKLDTQDAAALTKKLTETGTEYRLADGGTTIEVPSDLVYQTRIDLADVALPASGKVGYGILDNQSLTTSEFGQSVSFQRAMEGEFAKTIESIDGVDAAIVHLAIPKDQVFALDTEKPSASVMVKMTGKANLATEQVQAITNLVASGIQGLTPDRVTVTDSAGHVLAAPGQDGSGTGANGMHQEQLNSFQGSLESSIEGLLAASLGPDKAKVSVSADLDFDNTSSVTESYQPPSTAPGQNTAMPTNESTKVETYGSGANATQGQLGATGTPTTVAGGSGDYSLNERQVNYALGKVTETKNSAPGAVKRLSVAVLVDEKKVSASQIAELQQIVSAAAGIDTTRGDTVVVSRQKFDTSVQDALTKQLKNATAAPEPSSDLPILGGIAGLLLVGLVIIVFQLRKRKKDLAELEQLALDAGFIDAFNRNDDTTLTPAIVLDPLTIDARVPAGVGVGGGSMADHTLERRRDERREVVSELIDNQPDEVAQLLRGWLGDRRSVRR